MISTRIFLSFFIVLLLLTLLFLPGLHGDYIFDDSPNILFNSALKIPALGLDYLLEASFSHRTGAIGRPLPMLSFALNYYFFGTDPFSFKVVNLVLHFLNAILVFVFCSCLSVFSNSLASCGKAGGIPGYKISCYFPAIVALTWYILPINMSPVFYIVQRMTSMSTLFVLSALIFYMVFRVKLFRQKYFSAASFLFLASLSGVCGALSKETALLIPMYILAIEWFFVGPACPIGNKNKIGYAITSFVGLLPWAALVYLVLSDPKWLGDAYLLRDFTPIQRVLTEGRVLWFYFIQTLLPQNSVLGIYHDDWVLSQNIFHPISTLVSWLAWGAMGIASFLLRRIWPFVSFGIVFYLFGHSLEASFLSLELVHEHRNYLPSLGILLLFYSVIEQVAFRGQAVLHKIFRVTYVFMLSLVLSFRVSAWSDLTDHAKWEVYHHPQSFRAVYQYGRVLLMTGAVQQNLALVGRAVQQFEFSSTLDDDVMVIAALAYISINYPEIDSRAEHWLEVFVQKTANENIHENSLAAFGMLYELREKIPNWHTWVESVYLAALANPSISRKQRSDWLMHRARYAFASSRFEESERDVLRAIELQPNNKDSKFILAKYYISVGRDEDAYELLLSLNNGFFKVANPDVGYYLDQLKIKLNQK